MASGFRYKHNSAGVKELLNSGDTRDMLTDKAERVLAAAQASATVASGAYRDSLKVVQDSTDRAVARVSSDVPYGMIVEANTGNLARSLDAAAGG